MDDNLKLCFVTYPTASRGASLVHRLYLADIHIINFTQ